MRKFAIYISVVLTTLMAAAIVLPAVHALTHDVAAKTHDLPNDDLSITKASVDCSLCDFHFSSSLQIATASYDLYSVQKETVYSLSLEQTVYLFPNTLFSLRAPPAVMYS